MPRYNHRCETCTVRDYINSSVDGLSIFISDDAKDPYAEPLVWEEIYGMSESPTIVCPVCSAPSPRTMMGVRVSTLVKGNFLLNSQECRGLSDIHKLQYDDPYKEHRVTGEADDKISNIKKRLKRAHNWKTDRYKETKQRKKAAGRGARKVDLSTKRGTRLQ